MRYHWRMKLLWMQQQQAGHVLNVHFWQEAKELWESLRDRLDRYTEQSVAALMLSRKEKRAKPLHPKSR